MNLSFSETKAKLLQTLINSSDPAFSSRDLGVRFAVLFFHFVRHCRQEFVVPIEAFDPVEKTSLIQGLHRIIPKLGAQVSSESRYYSEKLEGYRKIRSGIEFITNEIVLHEDSLKEKWQKFLEGYGMEEMNEMLDHFTGIAAEYFTWEFAEDIRHVPKEHDRWIEEERMASEKYFGIDFIMKTSSSSPTPELFEKPKRNMGCCLQ